jgi:uncharacterized repeat protein (TIGR01451 family)
LQFKHLTQSFALLVISAVGMLFAGQSQAQIQRSIVNPSFEQAFTGARAAGLNQFFTLNPPQWIAVDAGEIPGWETTHPVVTNGCPAGGFAFTAAYNCTPIELWPNSFSGVTPANGIVLAELNAYTSSKLYQNVCMNTGETFAFNFAHRGRGGPDQAQFQIGAANAIVMDVTTNTSGTGTINAGSGATGTSAAGIAGGWTRYAGSFTYTGATGVQRLGFSAIATSGGNLSVGNLLDDINIALKPYIEFIGGTGGAVEGNAHAPPRIKIVGTVPAGGLVVSLGVSGTAAFGTKFDYAGTSTLSGITGSASNLSFTVPVGNYSDASANNVFDLPIRVLDNAIIEDNKTVVLTMPANSAGNPFVNASTTLCGGAFNPAYTHTLIDNDIDLQTTKTSPAGPQAIGSTITYTVTFANATPLVLSLAPTTAHDVRNVTISDPQPVGVTFSAWTCTATGTTCPTASGVGGISATAALPVGSVLTYAIQAVVTSQTYCEGTVTNSSLIASTATSPAGSGLLEGTSVEGNAGYLFKPNAASVSNAIFPCANLGISKTNYVSTLTAGQTVVYDIVASNGGPSAANNTVLKDPVAAGLICTAVACTAASGTASCPAPANVTLGLLQGTGILLNNFPANSSLTFQVTCGVL